MNSNNYVSVLTGFLVYLLFVLNFTACGKLQSSMFTEGKVDVNSTAQIVEWSYGNGSTIFSSKYDVVYRLDLSTKIFQLSVFKGSAVTEALPTGKSKTISDSELSQMKTILSQLSYKPCAPGSRLFGVGSELITLSNATTLTPTHQIYATDCTGNTMTASFQSLGGFENVKTLFKTF